MFIEIVIRLIMICIAYLAAMIASFTSKTHHLSGEEMFSEMFFAKIKNMLRSVLLRTGFGWAII